MNRPKHWFIVLQNLLLGSQIPADTDILLSIRTWTEYWYIYINNLYSGFSGSWRYGYSPLRLNLNRILIYRYSEPTLGFSGSLRYGYSPLRQNLNNILIIIFWVLWFLEIQIFSSPSEHEQKIDMLLFRTYSFIIIIYCPGNIKGLRHKVAWDINWIMRREITQFLYKL